MPRIDPQQLLKCLSVLLSSNGGIKSQDEVQRLASLMTKFSKKLVSKCIYVSILKATETELLAMFMSAGGWNLTYNWLSDGVEAKNWPLVTELVDLLLVCPVDINRLKTNACPKLIKTLSKDPSADENVRVLACKLVDLWLRIVRGDDSGPSTTEAVQPLVATSSSDTKSSSDDVCDGETKNKTADSSNTEGHLPVYKITIRDGKKVLAEISGGQRLSSEVIEEESSTETEDIHQEEGESVEEEVEDHVNDDDDDDEDYVVKPVKLRKRPNITKSKKQSVKRKPAKVQSSYKKERESTDSGSSASKSPNHQKSTSKPTPNKIKNDQQKIKINLKSKSSNLVDDDGDDLSSEIDNIQGISDNYDTEKLLKAKPKVKLNLSLKNKKNANLIKEKDKNDKKIEKCDIKEKKKLESNDKSKKKVESYDSLTDKEKESVSKFITPPISKLGKIPKKSAANKEEKQSEEKNRTLKEETSDNKSELKKTADIKRLHDVKRPEKKYSIEPKRPLSNESRPKTVKTYNSKFRSTGLEEEVKPPPSKTVPKKNTPTITSPLALLEKRSVKRSSPPPPEIIIPEKKLKPDSTIEDKKLTEKVGGIKLIPPKPKR